MLTQASRQQEKQRTERAVARVVPRFGHCVRILDGSRGDCDVVPGLDEGLAPGTHALTDGLQRTERHQAAGAGEEVSERGVAIGIRLLPVKVGRVVDVYARSAIGKRVRGR